MSYLLTAGTDGYIAFWPSPTSQRQIQSRSNLPDDISSLNLEYLDSDLQWNSRHRVHQSTIKCLTILRISHCEAILATGGDDNGVAFTHITCNTGSHKLPTYSTLLLPRAHASAVTGIQCLGCRAEDDSPGRRTSWRWVTISNDQRLKSWVLTVDSTKPGAGGLSLCKDLGSYSSVADASCMEVTPEGHGQQRRIIIAGIGVETWNVTNV